METTEQHFALDPELLEGFVLGRLDETTRARCEQHLRTCETCRQAVHVERVIAAGIKRAGRERLKERIAMLAGSPPRRQIPWPHVLSAAAVLLVLVGVGIYQGWFAARHVESRDVAVLERPAVEGKTQQATPQAQNKVGEPPREANRSIAPPATSHDAEHAYEPAESKLKGRDEKLGYAPAPADRLEESKEVASKDARKADVEENRPAVAATGGGQEFWAKGILISETLLKKEADKGSAETSVMARSARAADATPSGPDSLGRVTVEQRPLSTLPVSLQSRQQLYSQQTIQTLVRQSQGETQLTLYPESPFDSTQLHYARVQQVAPDSLIVRIGRQQIGYRLPAGVLRQGETSKAKRR